MTFKIINSNEGSLDYRGYRFADGSDRIYDNDVAERIRIVKGENYLDNLFDDFYDGCFEPICKADNGNLYAVLFDYVDNDEVPVIWQQVEKLE